MAAVVSRGGVDGYHLDVVLIIHEDDNDDADDVDDNHYDHDHNNNQPGTTSLCGVTENSPHHLRQFAGS